MEAPHTVLSLFPEIRADRRGHRRIRRPSSGRSHGPESGKVRFRPLVCQTILEERANRDLPLGWTINPYRGCQFGCPVCCARHAPGVREPVDPSTFATRIYVKFQAAQILAETVKAALLRGRSIAIGTAADPYQPIEERYRITRRILEVLVSVPDLELSITTRSPLVLRDLDVLQRIARSSRPSVKVSMITMHPRLARILEPASPSPQQRIETIRALSLAGIEVGIFVVPILPGITDSPSEIQALLRTCQKEGASYATGGGVRFSGSAWGAFAPTVRQHFPHLRTIYDAAASHEELLGDAVFRFCRSVFRSAREAVGLAAGPRPRSVDAGSGSRGCGPLFEKN